MQNKKKRVNELKEQLTESIHLCEMENHQWQ